MLAGYPILRTNDVDAFVSLIERKAQLRVHRVGRGGHGESRMHGLWLSRMSFSAAHYGFATALAPTSEMDTYHLSLPLRGEIHMVMGERRIAVEPGACAVVSPHQPCALDYPRDLQRVLLRVPAREVMRHVLLLTGKTPTRAPEFDPVLRPAQHGVATLVRHILVTMSRLDAGLLSPTASEASREIEGAILSALLLVCPGSPLREIEDRLLAPCPRSVHRVVDFIHANAHQPISLEELVLVSGVAGRTLFSHFRAFKGVGPMAYLRRVRMERVRDALAAAGPADTVTSIALKWGFHELGRFAVSYRRMYGEAPSATLRRPRKG